MLLIPPSKFAGDPDLPLHTQHRGRNLPQVQLRYVAGSKAEGVDGVTGVEVVDGPEISEMPVRIDPAAREQHIGNAVFKGSPVLVSNKIFTELFQHTSVK